MGLDRTGRCILLGEVRVYPNFFYQVGTSVYGTRAKRSLILMHRYFGDTQLRDQTVNAVLGYTPTVPHWAYNGNARRYWDFRCVKAHFCVCIDLVTNKE